MRPHPFFDTRIQTEYPFQLDGIILNVASGFVMNAGE